MLFKLLKLIIFFGPLLFSYLVIIDTNTGMEPTSLPKFHLQHQLKDIPNLDLDRLKNAEYYSFPGVSIEDIAVDRNGKIYLLSATSIDGPSNIYQISPHNYSLYNKLGQTGGFTAGTALNKEENLLAFIDSKQGIRILNLQTKQIKTVATTFKGKKFTSLNSITFGPNSSLLYFTHSSTLDIEAYHLEILYKTGTGQVIELNLQTGQMRLILGGLQFANGIAYDQKQNCLYVTQMNYYRLIKVDLFKQPNQDFHKYTVLIQNLIGYPDNLKLAEDGKLWIGIPSIRDKISVFVDNHPAIRKALINANIPEKIFSKFANVQYSGGLKFDPKTRKIVDYYFGKSAKIDFVTGIFEKNHKIYMASLQHNTIAIAGYI